MNAALLGHRLLIVPARPIRTADKNGGEVRDA